MIPISIRKARTKVGFIETLDYGFRTESPALRPDRFDVIGGCGRSGGDHVLAEIEKEADAPVVEAWLSALRGSGPVPDQPIPPRFTHPPVGPLRCGCMGAQIDATRNRCTNTARSAGLFMRIASDRSRTLQLDNSRDTRPYVLSSSQTPLEQTVGMRKLFDAGKSNWRSFGNGGAYSGRRD